MQPVMSREEMRAFDRYAIDTASVPSLVLMENAGRGAADDIAANIGPSRVVVVCGPGNNGGDGFVVARRLLVAGHDVVVFCTSATLRGDAEAMKQAWLGVGGALHTLPGGQVTAEFREHVKGCDVLVDALFGTGLDRALTGHYLSLLSELHAAEAHKVALDLPSGLDSNTGQALGGALHVDRSIAFGHLKRGLCTPQGAAYAGQVTVVDIGVPATLGSAATAGAVIVSEQDLADDLQARALGAHKGDAGRVWVLAGSLGKLGAAHLASRGALRGGAGLVTLVNTPEVIDQLEAGVAEAMTARLDPTDLSGSLAALAMGSGALAIGPGLGTDERALALVRAALSLDLPCVLDADALTLHGGKLGELKARGAAVVLTPHPGEAARLLGVNTESIERDRYGAVGELVAKSGCTVLLKGRFTLIAAPEQPIQVIGRGSPVLATGGSGDVLTGLIATHLGRLPALRAARLSAFIHALAGERWAARHQADRGMLASDIADELSDATAQLSLAHAHLTD